MPARYEAIRDKFKTTNKYRSDKLAKRHAAMIENALRRKEGKPPMTQHHEHREA